MYAQIFTPTEMLHQIRGEEVVDSNSIHYCSCHFENQGQVLLRLLLIVSHHNLAMVVAGLVHAVANEQIHPIRNRVAQDIDLQQQFLNRNRESIRSRMPSSRPHMVQMSLI